MVGSKSFQKFENGKRRQVTLADTSRVVSPACQHSILWLVDAARNLGANRLNLQQYAWSLDGHTKPTCEILTSQILTSVDRF
jgi:hypothetical protein